MPDVRRSQYLSAREAAALLGVSRGSLYSYVSRGRLRVVHNGRDPRVSRYLAADVERLRDQKEARLRPEAAARKTLELGLPVLESSLTLIDAGRVY
jgi:citrate synthase